MIRAPVFPITTPLRGTQERPSSAPAALPQRQLAQAQPGTRRHAPLPLGARLSNIALTAQVQLSYNCAQDSALRARQQAQRIAQTWPASALRDFVLGAYEAQAQAAQTLANAVLEAARHRCGLAYARV